MSTTQASRRAPTRDVLRLLLDIYRARPRTVIGLIVITLVNGVRTAIYMLSIRGITQGIVDRDLDQAMVWGIAFTVAALFENIMWLVDWFLTSIVTDHAVFAIQDRVLRVAATAELIAFEQATFAERLERATDAVGTRLADIISSIRQLLAVLSAGTSVALSLLVIDARLIPILFAGALPGYWLQVRVAHLMHEARLQHARTDVLLEKLATILTSRAAAAEVRLFGIGPRLTDEWTMHRTRRSDAVTDALQRQSRAGMGSELVHVVALAVAFGLVLWQVLDQSLPLGSWAMVAAAGGWTIGLAHATMSQGSVLRESTAYIGDIFAFEDEANRVRQATRQRREAADRTTPGEPVNPDQRAMRIEARALTFCYPGDGRVVVDDVSLTIEPGEHIAIVGENGAGKSTLVRLLAGLYLPEDGTVLQDGIDTRSSAALRLRKHIGVVFQHFSTWQLTLRENIGFGDVSHLDDDVRLIRAAERAGAAEVAASLPEEWESFLGRTFGDRDLSGGEWQRIALARAFFRPSRFLILDEPTSALDPLAEQRLFDQFNQLTAGRTAITVSHRLGPARFSDRIIVLEHGRIIEAGTPDELMTAGGRYHQMFEAQASWYREDNEVSSE